MGKSLRRRPPSTGSASSSPHPQNPSRGRRSSGQSSLARSSPTTPQSRVNKPSRVRASSFALRSARRTRTRRQLQADLDACNSSKDSTPSSSRPAPSRRRATNDMHDVSVDKLLHDVRTLMRSNDPANNAGSDQDDIRSLRDALKRADDQFHKDATPADGSSSSSTTEAVRDELGVAESVPRLREAESKEGKSSLLSQDQPGPKSSKKHSRTPQTERLARYRARLEKSRLSPAVRPKPDEKDSDDSGMETSMFDHKKDIEALKRDDPEFYKFLEENDATLLDVDDLTFNGDVDHPDSEDDDGAVDESNDGRDDPEHAQLPAGSASARGAGESQSTSSQDCDDVKPEAAVRSSTSRRKHSVTPQPTGREYFQWEGPIAVHQEQRISASSPSRVSDDHSSGSSAENNSSDSESADSEPDGDVAKSNADKSDLVIGDKGDSQSGTRANETPELTATQVSKSMRENTKSPREQRSALKSIKRDRSLRPSSDSESISSGSESSAGRTCGLVDEGALPEKIASLNDNTDAAPDLSSLPDISKKAEDVPDLKAGEQAAISIPDDLSGTENRDGNGVTFVKDSLDTEEIARTAIVDLDGDDHGPEFKTACESTNGSKASVQKELSVQSVSDASSGGGDAINLEVPIVVLESQPVELSSGPDSALTQDASLLRGNRLLKSSDTKSKDHGSLTSSATKVGKGVFSRRVSLVASRENNSIDDRNAIASDSVATQNVERASKSQSNTKASEDPSCAEPEEPSLGPSSLAAIDTEDQDPEKGAQVVVEVEFKKQGGQSNVDRTGYSSSEDSDEENLEEAALRESGIEGGSADAVNGAGSNEVLVGQGQGVALNKAEPDSKSEESSESGTGDDKSVLEADGNGVVLKGHEVGSDDDDMDVLDDTVDSHSSSDVVCSDSSDGEEKNSEDPGADGDEECKTDSDDGGDGSDKMQKSIDSSEKHALDEDADLTAAETLVDLKYLRRLKEIIDSNRASPNICKRLLLILQSGRDILPKSVISDGKHQQKGSKGPGNESDLIDDESGSEEDEYQKDGTIKAGKLKFVSTKAYQQAMNLAIIGLQDVLDRLLGKPTGKKVTNANLAKWVPSDSGRWGNIQPIFRGFLYNLLGLCDTVVDAPTLRFLLKRMERVAPYTHENTNLLKKILRVVLRIWSTDLQRISQETKLQAYLLLNKLAHVSGNTEMVLRCTFNSFTSNIAAVCNPKTLPLIRFAIACLVELYGIDMGASYSTLFTYLREMAVTLRTVLVSKDESEDIEKIHNWKFINELRLWSRVLAKYGEEDELRPLIYPYVQVSLGVMTLHPTPRAFPLRLHVASFLTDIVQETGVYIPVVPNLLLLLRCSELKKHPKHSDVKGLEWRALLRVSEDAVKSKGFLSGLVDGVAFEISRIFAVISKHVSFPELSFVAESALRKAAKTMAIPESKAKLILVASKLKATADEIVKARSKADLAPQGAISSRGMLACVPGMDTAMKMPIERLFEVEQERMQKQNRLRDEISSQKRPNPTLGEDDEDESESDSVASREVEQKPSKKAKLSSSKKGKTPLPSLHVPDVKDNDEQDHVAKLDLNSDGSASE